MKIKYKNIKVKNEVKRLESPNFPDLEWLMLELTTKYYLENPIVLGIEEIDYDFFGITLKDDKQNGRTIKLIFAPFLRNINYQTERENKLVTVKISDRNYYDVFLVNKNNISICKSVYEKEDNLKLEKYYTKSEKSRLLMNISDTNYFVYRYHFENNYLQSVLTLKFKTTFLFQETAFIKHLLNQKEEIKDITMLYSLIQKMINPSDMIIEITNQTPLHQDELLDVENGCLRSYIRYQMVDGVYKKYDYRDGELIVTTKEKVQNSPELNKVIKLVRGDKN